MRDVKKSRKIISVSRRTDIPAFYENWFFRNLKQGYVFVKNPYNSYQIKKISLKKEDVLCFVFWTKNPFPMFAKLDLLNEYNYYFLFTLNPYGNDIETNVPDKNRLIEIFRTLSEKIGKKRVIWRYDPILLSEKYDLEFHYRQFEFFVEKLHCHTEKCIISFIDFYKKTMNRQGIEVDTLLLINMKKLIDELLKQKVAKIYASYDELNEVGSMAFFGWDNKRAYYIFGASDPKKRSGQSGTSVIWDALYDLSKNGIKEVDMEGVNSPARGWFKLSFGGELKPYYEISLGK